MLCSSGTIDLLGLHVPGLRSLDFEFASSAVMVSSPGNRSMLAFQASAQPRRCWLMQEEIPDLRHMRSLDRLDLEACRLLRRVSNCTAAAKEPNT